MFSVIIGMMIGVDIVKNERIKEAIERFGDRFLKRIYTDRELSYCTDQRAIYECLSARWACKEAVLKAFFSEFGILLRFKEIEVLGKRGFPAEVNIKNEEAKKALGSRKIIVSLSHEKDYSVAVAIIR